MLGQGPGLGELVLGGQAGGSSTYQDPLQSSSPSSPDLFGGVRQGQPFVRNEIALGMIRPPIAMEDGMAKECFNRDVREVWL